MKKLQTFLLLVVISLSSEMVGQAYEHSLGVRAGYSSGITYKGFLRHRMAAIEGDLLYNRHGFNLTALFDYHLEPFRDKRLMTYLGGGAFGGEWGGEFSLGLAGVAGIEFMVRDLPLNFSLEWKPMINLYRLFEVDLLDFGLSIRYRFSL